MDWFKKKTFSFKIKLVFIVDFIILIFAYLFVNNYKFFSILITSIVLCYLSFEFSDAFVQLINLNDSKSQIKPNKLQLNWYNFLFKNEQIYQLLSKFLKYKLDVEENLDKYSNKKQEENNIQLKKQIASLVGKISQNFIETWYFDKISNDNQFITESNIQLQHILKDLIERFVHVNKIDLFSKLMMIFNRNFINFSINFDCSKIAVPIEKLHPAIRNLPESEKIFIKKFVLIVLRKSGNILDTNNYFLEELLTQIIGKNCIQKLVDLISKPEFLYFALCCALDKEKTTQARTQVIENVQEIFYSGSDDDSEYCTPEDSNQKDEKKQHTLSNTELSMQNPLYEMENATSVLFLEVFNIGIISSETSKESKTGKEYTNYVIKFEYKFSSISSDLNKDFGNDNLEIRTKLVKRRFKEFVSLQKNLEDQFHLKNFKGPSKFNSPIGNMETEIVEKRRIRLNKYLNSLICLTEICQSKYFINFLGLNSKNEHIKENQNSSIFRSVSETLFERNSSKSDPIVNFANILPTSYEYSREDSFIKFRSELAILLKETRTVYESFFKNEIADSKNLTDTNFSKNLLEIVNKLLVSASLIHHIPTKFWFNHKNIYKLLESTICEFYAERFFEDKFNKLLSSESFTIYLQNIEISLFCEENQRKYKNPEYDVFLKNLLMQKIPDLVKKIFGKRLDYSLDVFINCFKYELLNKHFVYCMLELFLYFMYPEEYDRTNF